MKDARLFIPFARSRAVPVFEGRITRDLTMPERDWRAFDVPTYKRRCSSDGESACLVSKKAKVRILAAAPNPKDCSQ